MKLSDRIVESLGRVTRSGKLIPEIDGLRFIAILAVILTHIGSSLDSVDRSPRDGLDTLMLKTLEGGVAGVQLFFAISGFILALPFAEASLGPGRPVSLPRYYRRRVLRIEPPYIINLSLLMAAALAMHGMARADRIPHFLASLFYVHNLAYNDWSEVNFVAWSLEVEVQFYLLAPLLARVFRIRRAGRRRALIVAVSLALGLAAIGARGLPYGLRNLVVFHLQYFLAGFLLADLFVTEWRERPERRRIWDVVTTVALAGVFLSPRGPAPEVLIAPLVFLACVGVLRGPLWGRAMANRWVVVFGGMCYTVYLYHFWIWKAALAVLSQALPSLPLRAALVVYSIAAIPFIFAVSSLLFVLFERPFMYPDWPSRFRLAARGLLAGRKETVPVTAEERG